jgi:hypothetical protein
MAVDRSLESFFEDASRSRSVVRDEGAPLQNGDGGGTSGGMEARLARLESDMDHVKRDVGELKADVRNLLLGVETVKASNGVIEEKLRHVATVPQMWAAAIGIVSALGGIVALIVRFLPHAG